MPKAPFCHQPCHPSHLGTGFLLRASPWCPNRKSPFPAVFLTGCWCRGCTKHAARQPSLLAAPPSGPSELPRVTVRGGCAQGSVRLREASAVLHLGG